MFSKANSSVKINTSESLLSVVTGENKLSSSRLVVCDYGSYAYFTTTVLTGNKRLLNAYIRPEQFNNGYYVDVVAAQLKLYAVSIDTTVSEETPSIHAKKRIDCIPSGSSVILILPTEIIDNNVVRVFLPKSPALIYSYVEV